MKENPFLSVDEQINLLESRGMIVDIPDILLQHNYAHLIHRYGKLYHDPTTDKLKYKFKKGTKLSHLFNLYKLNNEVSFLILKYIVQFEHLLKTFVAKKIGEEDPLWHYKKENFNSINEEYKEKFICLIFEALERIKKEDDWERHSYKNEIPIWKLVDELAFGQLRNIISVLI